MIAVLLLGILGTLGVLYWDLDKDIKKFYGQIDVMHRKEFWDRVGLLFFPWLAFTLYLLNYLHIPDCSIWVLFVLSGLLSASMQGFWFLLLFDGIYNVRLGRNWWFNGKAEGKTDDSVLDANIWRKLPDWAEASIKINGVLISTILYIVLC